MHDCPGDVASRPGDQSEADSVQTLARGDSRPRPSWSRAFRYFNASAVRSRQRNESSRRDASDYSDSAVYPGQSNNDLCRAFRQRSNRQVIRANPSKPLHRDYAFGWTACLATHRPQMTLIRTDLRGSYDITRNEPLAHSSWHCASDIEARFNGKSATPCLNMKRFACFSQV